MLPALPALLAPAQHLGTAAHGPRDGPVLQVYHGYLQGEPVYSRPGARAPCPRVRSLGLLGGQRVSVAVECSGKEDVEPGWAERWARWGLLGAVIHPSPN